MLGRMMARELAAAAAIAHVLLEASRTGSPVRPGRAADWLKVAHARDRPRLMQAFSNVTRHAYSTCDVRLRRADGEYRWFRVCFTADSTRRGVIARWYGVAIDIDDAHRVAIERDDVLASERNARAAAEQANRRKDQFLATVSHELRAPLTAMLLWSKVLRDGAVGAELRAQAIDAIYHSALAQSRLIGDLLDVSRAIAGKLNVDLRPTDIGNVIRKAVAAIAPVVAAKRIELESSCAPALGAVRADAARLRQVLDNLLSNAVKFTLPGGRIAIAARRRGRAVIIEVKDTGRGIPPEFLPRVFEPFSQADDAVTRREGGLGLGLAIAKQLIELHHGSLAVSSPGRRRGATFRVVLPAAGPRRAPSRASGC